METCFEPVSLGSDCAQKFQIGRALYQRAHPHGSVDRLRTAFGFGQASKIFRRLPFDAQVTPMSALLAYLEHDFTGVFEREDLVVDEGGFVVHRKLGVEHPHEFHAVDGRLDQAVIDAQYPAARSKFDHLAAKFRHLLTEPGPFLYIRGMVPCRSDAIRLIQLLSDRGPHHRFRLLFAGSELRTDLDDLDDRISQGLVASTNDKPPELRWEGDDASWDRLLQPFNIGLPRGPVFTANFNIVEALPENASRAVDLEWSLLPDVQPSRQLPLTFEVADIPWAFAALSETLDDLSADMPTTLILKIEALHGHVGVGLVSADGRTTIGKEYWLCPEDGLLNISLPLEPGMGSARAALRNYGYMGGPGAVRVHGVSQATG